MTNRPAWLAAGYVALAADGTAIVVTDPIVALGQQGAGMVLTALEKARRSWKMEDGDPAVSAAFNQLFRATAEGSVARPAARARVLPVSSSAPMVGTAKAGEILGITAHSVVKAIAAGRLPATRVGRVWMLREIDVRVAEYGKTKRGKGSR